MTLQPTDDAVSPRQYVKVSRADDGGGRAVTSHCEARVSVRTSNQVDNERTKSTRTETVQPKTSVCQDNGSLRRNNKTHYSVYLQGMTLILSPLPPPCRGQREIGSPGSGNNEQRICFFLLGGGWVGVTKKKKPATEEEEENQ